MIRANKKIRILYSVIAILVAAVIAFPVIWMIPAAFKTKSELFTIPNTFLAKEFTLENFIKVFQVDVNGSTYLKALGSTTVVALISTVLSLSINMFAGYVFARFEFRGKRFLWAFVMVSMFIPGITIMLTSIRMINLLHMNDTLWALIVPGLANSYNIFFFRQFYLSIPQNIEEAALIDGESKFMMFFRIFLPMSTTPMVIIGVGTFMECWNNFIWPTLTVTDNTAITQIMQIIRSLNGSYQGEYGVVIAATLMSLIIPIVLFAVFQKRILEGISLTGMK